MEEQEAIARLKQGDIRGLRALVREHQVQAIRTAYLITRDRAMAEDIVQAAFVRAYERIDQFDAGRAFAPWFLRSVANDALKAVTRGKRHISLEGSLDRDNEQGEPVLAEALAALDPGPEELVEAAELRQAVWDALGRLPPEQRATIALYYYLDLSVAEIATRLACPPGTVKWRLHAARERLRGLLRLILWPTRSESRR
jgi:RNA polymerase sigma-70 factor, ECF subfamily